MTSNLFKLLSFVVLTFLTAFSSGWAHIHSTGTISGTVVDTSGAAVPGVLDNDC